MKKIILALFLFMGCLPSFADDSNQIRPIYLRNLDVINPNNNVSYFSEGLKIEGGSSDNENIDFYDLGVKTIFYNKEGKKVSQDIQDTSYNGHFEIKTPADLSPDIISYKVIPIQHSKFDYYSYIKNRLQLTIWGIQGGYEITDFIHSQYSTPEKLLNRDKGLLSIFSMFKETYPNGYMLPEGTQILFKVLNKSCNSYNEYNNERPSERNACVKMVVDINGFDFPNKFTTTEEMNDRFKFLLYANKLVPYEDSVEEAILKGWPINTSLSYSIQDAIRYKYKKWVKNLNVSYTYPSYKIVADNTGDKSIIADIKIEFYNKNGERFATDNIENWEVYPTHNDFHDDNTTYMNIPLNFDKLDKNVEFFDIIITNKKKK